MFHQSHHLLCCVTSCAPPRVSPEASRQQPTLHKDLIIPHIKSRPALIRRLCNRLRGEVCVYVSGGALLGLEDIHYSK